MAAEDINKLTPQEFFETIGDKVKNLAPATTSADDAEDDEPPAVEEIESLCMNCGKNVWIPKHSRLLLSNVILTD